MAEMSSTAPAAQTYTRRAVVAPLRSFLRTESGSAGVLVLAIVAALVWANVDAGSYESVWRTDLSIRIGGHGVTRDLRTWVNSGLMTFFFLVVGLEARREFDLGDLRDRRRFVLPLVAGIARDARARSLIYLAFNAAGGAARGWGVAMSTDTALALGLLALLGRRRAGPGPGLPADRVRRRRPGRAARDRGRLQRAGRAAADPARRARAGRHGRHARARGATAAPAYLLVRRGDVVGAADQRRRPGGGRAGDRPDRAGVLARAAEPGGGDRAVPPVPRAADRRAGPDRGDAG